MTDDDVKSLLQELLAQTYAQSALITAILGLLNAKGITTGAEQIAVMDNIQFKFEELQAKAPDGEKLALARARAIVEERIHKLQQQPRP